MAHIYEGNLQMEMRALEKQLHKSEDLHPTLSFNSPRNRSYAILAAALFIGAMAVAASAEATHDCRMPEGGASRCYTSRGIISTEGKVISKNFTAGYDNKTETLDDKLFLELEDRAGTYGEPKLSNFRVETDIRENLSALQGLLTEGGWLKFRYQAETHRVVQIDEILPPEYTAMREQEELANKQNQTNMIPLAIAVGAVAAGGAILIAKKGKKDKSKDES